MSILDNRKLIVQLVSEALATYEIRVVCCIAKFYLLRATAAPMSVKSGTTPVLAGQVSVQTQREKDLSKQLRKEEKR